jgi:hypothetical protein
MKRQNIDNGKWFDLDAAETWEEDTWWNGNNHISRATGDQFAHEQLYRTAKGTWVLHAWSQWQGSGQSWTEIEQGEAMAWLLRNGHADEVEQIDPSALAEAEA